jgi:hypothetical protein
MVMKAWEGKRRAGLAHARAPSRLWRARARLPLALLVHARYRARKRHDAFACSLIYIIAFLTLYLLA